MLISGEEEERRGEREGREEKWRGWEDGCEEMQEEEDDNRLYMCVCVCIQEWLVGVLFFF